MVGYINACLYGRKETAFIVDEGKFVKFGSNEEIQKEFGWQDEIIDLQGQFVLPGFIASGMQIAKIGKREFTRSVNKAQTRQDISNIINSCDDTFVTLYGYDKDTTEEINRALLDEMDDTRPVMIFSEDEEVIYMNSKAFAVIDPVVKEEEEASGIVKGDSRNDIFAYVSINDKDMIEKILVKGLENLPKYGVTSAVSDDFTACCSNYTTTLSTLRKLAYEQKLPINLYEDFTFANPKEFSSFLDEGYGQFIYEDNLHFNHLHVRLDGTYRTHTAALQKEYADTQERGTLHLSDEELTLYIKLANSFNTGVTIESQGDAALDQSLEVLADTMYENNPLYDTLSPLFTLNENQLQTLIDLHATVQAEPSTYLLSEMIKKRRVVDEETLFPLKTLNDNVLCVGVAKKGNVLSEIYHAVTRRDNEAVNIDQAIDLYTKNAAKALMADDTIGTLAENYQADFVVLDQDITKIPASQILTTNIVLTSLHGNITYRR